MMYRQDTRSAILNRLEITAPTTDPVRIAIVIQAEVVGESPQRILSREMTAMAEKQVEIENTSDKET